jgi:hypothetical protein
MLLSKIAAIAALGVALFPCKCDIYTPDIPYVHGAAAAIMFVVLANFCLIFYRRARTKGHIEANRRAAVYASCGIAIVISILVIALDNFMKGAISAHIPRLTYYGERTGLIAFGISWLTASRVLPVLTRQDERFSPFSDRDTIDSIAK